MTDKTTFERLLHAFETSGHVFPEQAADLAQKALKIHNRVLKKIMLEHQARMQADLDAELAALQALEAKRREGLCVDEGCPHAGTDHICLDLGRTRSLSSEFKALLACATPGIASAEGTTLLERGERVVVRVPHPKPMPFFIDLPEGTEEVQAIAPKPLPIVTMIAAVGRHNVIGMDQRIPWHIKGDFQHFKEVTMGKPMIMGRKTFDSIGKGLPGRLSIVVTRDKTERKNTKNVTFCHRTSEALEIAQEYLTEVGGNEIMIIGGEDIYRLFMPRADRLLITHVEDTTEGADTLEPGKVARFPIIHAGEWRSQGRDYPTVEQVNPGEPYWYVEEYRKRKPE